MLRQFRTSTALLVALLVATGCGIKGPLVMPPPSTPPVAAPATAPAAPTTTTPAPAIRKP